MATYWITTSEGRYLVDEVNFTRAQALGEEYARRDREMTSELRRPQPLDAMDRRRS